MITMDLDNESHRTWEIRNCCRLLRIFAQASSSSSNWKLTKSHDGDGTSGLGDLGLLDVHDVHDDTDVSGRDIA
jgi:hypothetical protein